jgi:hypothetical protein
MLGPQNYRGAYAKIAIIITTTTTTTIVSRDSTKVDSDNVTIQR